jgi:hypothetical protein
MLEKRQLAQAQEREQKLADARAEINLFGQADSPTVGITRPGEETIMHNDGFGLIDANDKNPLVKAALQSQQRAWRSKDPELQKMIMSKIYPDTVKQAQESGYGFTERKDEQEKAVGLANVKEHLKQDTDFFKYGYDKDLIKKRTVAHKAEAKVDALIDAKAEEIAYGHDLNKTEFKSVRNQMDETHKQTGRVDLAIKEGGIRAKQLKLKSDFKIDQLGVRQDDRIETLDHKLKNKKEQTKDTYGHKKIYQDQVHGNRKDYQEQGFKNDTQAATTAFGRTQERDQTLHGYGKENQAQRFENDTSLQGQRFKNNAALQATKAKFAQEQAFKKNEYDRETARIKNIRDSNRQKQAQQDALIQIKQRGKTPEGGMGKVEMEGAKEVSKRRAIYKVAQENKAYDKARASQAKAQQMRSLSNFIQDSKVDVGWTEGISGFVNYFDDLFGSEAAAKKIAAKEYIYKMSNLAVIQLSSTGTDGSRALPGQLSNSDVELLKNTVGQLTTSEEGFKLLAEMGELEAKRDQVKADYY